MSPITQNYTDRDYKHFLKMAVRLYFLATTFLINSHTFAYKEQSPWAGTKDYAITTVQPLTRGSPGHGIYPSRYAFRAFGNIYNLKLTEAKHVVSNYAGYGLPVRIIDNNESRDIMVDFSKKGVRFFHDEDNNGAFAISLVNGTNTDEFAFEGLMSWITHDVIIKPIQDNGRHRRNINGYIQHIVYRRWSRVEYNGTRKKRNGVGYMFNSFDARTVAGSGSGHASVGGGGFTPGSLAGGRQSSYNSPSDYSSFIKPQTGVGNLYQQMLASSASHRIQVNPAVAHVIAAVEMLAWTDLSFLKSFQTLLRKSDVEMDILKYLATTVNAANLRYKRGIQDPTLNISVSLSGVVICKTSNCSTFTEGIRIGNSVNNYGALDAFAETLQKAYNESMFQFKYDYAAAFTRLDIIDPQGTPIGVSFTDKICSVSDGKSSSVIEDQGGYSSVGTVVHELAHTLGSDHDGWFRGRNCRAADGYIMSSLSPLTKNGFYFSQCSVNSIKENLVKSNASCVHDQPIVNHLYTSLVTELPGQIYNASEQCRQIYGTHFCLSVGTKLEDICYKMYCWDSILPNVCSTKTPAALGTSCGPSKWCVSGECVHDLRAP